MTCSLPATGLGANIELLLALGFAFLLVGATLLLGSRGPRRAPGAAVVLLAVLGVAILAATLGGSAPAQAAGPECSTSTTSDARLEVSQTSTMVGLAPGVAPAPITGRLVNRSDQSTQVSAVDVEITGITPSPDAAAGVCGPSDYQLNNSRMRIRRTLAPGGTTAFAGASIGFADKSINQDACQGATVRLRYTANPH